MGRRPSVHNLTLYLYKATLSIIFNFFSFSRNRSTDVGKILHKYLLLMIAFTLLSKIIFFSLHTCLDWPYTIWYPNTHVNNNQIIKWSNMWEVELKLELKKLSKWTVPVLRYEAGGRGSVCPVQNTPSVNHPTVFYHIGGGSLSNICVLNRIENTKYETKFGPVQAPTSAWAGYLLLDSLPNFLTELSASQFWVRLEVLVAKQKLTGRYRCFQKSFGGFSSNIVKRKCLAS